MLQNDTVKVIIIINDALTELAHIALDMSNTGRTKKLASFNCDQKMWEQFIARCKNKGTTATATLTQFIELYLDDSLNDLDAIAKPDFEQPLDSKIRASVEEYLDNYFATNNNTSANSTNPTILAICSRLDKLESALDSDSSNQTREIQNFAELSQQIEAMTARITQFADAIIKIQAFLNNQPRQKKKSYNNSSNLGYTSRIQPLTESSLASRLGVGVETVREKRKQLHSPLFVAWCKSKDNAGIGWEFHENTGLFHPVG